VELPEENFATEGLLLGALLRVPFSVIAETLEKGLAAAGYGEVRRAHFPVLQYLSERSKGARTTDLAAWAHITKPSMVYLVNSLEEHGYVERLPDPVDGRAQSVRLTARGLEVVRTNRRLVRQIEADWEARIGASRMEQLKQILRDLIASLKESREGAR
jgi:DNA-binding MarR family transcriptional regulator